MDVKHEYGWKFTSRDDASFIMKNPFKNSRMYLPLCNNRLKSYLTPELKGDMLLNFYKYLTIPRPSYLLLRTMDATLLLQVLTIRGNMCLCCLAAGI